MTRDHKVGTILTFISGLKALETSASRFLANAGGLSDVQALSPYHSACRKAKHSEATKNL
jgi:hypothetical protein